MAKIKIIISLLALGAVIVALTIIDTKKDSSFAPSPEENGKNAVLSENKDELKSQINSMLDKANYCSADSDCVSTTEFSCCSILVNKNADLEKTKEGIDKYGNDFFSLCPYVLCLTPPEKDEIQCVDNKCVDLRLKKQ